MSRHASHASRVSVLQLFSPSQPTPAWRTLRGIPLYIYLGSSPTCCWDAATRQGLLKGQTSSRYCPLLIDMFILFVKSEMVSKALSISAAPSCAVLLHGGSGSHRPAGLWAIPWRYSKSKEEIRTYRGATTHKEGQKELSSG